MKILVLNLKFVCLIVAVTYLYSFLFQVTSIRPKLVSVRLYGFFYLQYIGF